ncbi:hypothetical protein [Xanthomonas hortorum]|uniref:hypothetical protein n=1 Tax=Xanthomonas hortorum TaxID=56454 RepID=UPI0015D602DB|nr:hypothetical protein [Xanthomonas hortorum]MCE4359638.1 hypothetical protein [Xanthomonas hortorum pv. taraxaci]NMI53171.1 hypothetical protein [Xanthomonas hortorum pv. taraxaci]CAD0299327.1 hypothetical protein NCPPB940_01600 [Xanthomonas hortorum pv. taraxaci]CAD0299332.1 hypothetical protein NCPPB940_01600 [Xanthomonas hortorum pv. taraxaci]
MLAPLNVISELANCAEWADRLVRADLMHGIVVSENDYTSNFTSALRREINSRAIPGVSAHSQVLTPRIERKTGTDGCIIFRNKSHFKVGLFEAKWPRLSTHTNCWDSMQKSTGKSHFDSQLARQHPLNNFAVWEMFYSEESYGANALFPYYGSACVWHDDAFSVSSGRNQAVPWDDVELTALLGTSKNAIDQIVKDICMCSQGAPLPAEDLQGQLRELGIKGKILVIDLAESLDQ